MESSVSIITPSYNGGKFIGKTIESVVAQSFSNWELIIVDDCSTDNSVELIQSYISRDKRIHLIRHEVNSGAAVARNTALRATKGRYIAFLDVDDIWLPHKLTVQIDFMQRSGCTFCYSAYEQINEQGEVVGNIGVPSRVEYRELLKTCVIGCLTVVYDTEYFGKIEMPLIRRRQDFGLWLKLLKKTDFAFGIEQTLAQYRVRSDSISANKIVAAKYTWSLYRNFERLSILVALYYFIHYALRGFLRSKIPKLARVLGVLR